MKTDRHFAPITGQQRQPCRQTAPGAGAANGNALRVDAQFAGIRRQPRKRGVTIFHRRGEGMLWGQAILNRHNDGVDILGQVARPCVIAGHIAQHIAAAMNPQQGRQERRSGSWLVDAHKDIGITRRAGDVAVCAAYAFDHGRR